MDTVFTLKDVIYFCVILCGALGGFFALKITVNSLYGRMSRTEKDIEKNEKTMLKKFSSVHSRMEKSEENNKGEFSKINNEMGEIKLSVNSIEAKLDILINRK